MNTEIHWKRICKKKRRNNCREVKEGGEEREREKQ